MLMTARRQRQMKCEGRFVELRQNLEEALDLVLSDTKNGFTLEHLAHVHTLLHDEFDTYDARDNYFHKDGRDLRATPPPLPASLVPLLAKDVVIEPLLVDEYLYTVAPDLSKKLRMLLTYFGEKRRVVDFFNGSHIIEPKGYYIKTNFGIGNIQGEAVVSDTPFNLELWEQTAHQQSYEHAFTVGFWISTQRGKSVAFVDQIQEARHIETKHHKDLGTVGIKYLCGLGRLLGLDEVLVCPAERHPMFFEHPERKPTKVPELKLLYDKAAKDLLFAGNEKIGYYERLR